MGTRVAGLDGAGVAGVVVAPVPAEAAAAGELAWLLPCPALVGVPFAEHADIPAAGSKAMPASMARLFMTASLCLLRESHDMMWRGASAGQGESSPHVSQVVTRA